MKRSLLSAFLPLALLFAASAQESLPKPVDAAKTEIRDGALSFKALGSEAPRKDLSADGRLILTKGKFLLLYCDNYKRPGNLVWEVGGPDADQIVKAVETKPGSIVIGTLEGTDVEGETELPVTAGTGLRLRAITGTGSVTVAAFGFAADGKSLERLYKVQIDTTGGEQVDPKPGPRPKPNPNPNIVTAGKIYITTLEDPDNRTLKHAAVLNLANWRKFDPSWCQWQHLSKKDPAAAEKGYIAEITAGDAAGKPIAYPAILYQNAETGDVLHKETMPDDFKLIEAKANQLRKK